MNIVHRSNIDAAGGFRTDRLNSGKEIFFDMFPTDNPVEYAGQTLFCHFASNVHWVSSDNTVFDWLRVRYDKLEKGGDNSSKLSEPGWDNRTRASGLLVANNDIQLQLLLFSLELLG